MSNKFNIPDSDVILMSEAKRLSPFLGCFRKNIKAEVLNLQFFDEIMYIDAELNKGIKVGIEKKDFFGYLNSKDFELNNDEFNNFILRGIPLKQFLIISKLSDNTVLKLTAEILDDEDETCEPNYSKKSVFIIL
jgi:hypothetical protein